MEGEEIEGGHFGEVRRLRGVILEGEEIEGGHSGQVRRLRGVIWRSEEQTFGQKQLTRQDAVDILSTTLHEDQVKVIKTMVNPPNQLNIATMGLTASEAKKAELKKVEQSFTITKHWTTASKINRSTNHASQPINNSSS